LGGKEELREMKRRDAKSQEVGDAALREREPEKARFISEFFLREAACVSSYLLGGKGGGKRLNIESLSETRGRIFNEKGRGKYHQGIVVGCEKRVALLQWGGGGGIARNLLKNRFAGGRRGLQVGGEANLKEAGN